MILFFLCHFLWFLRRHFSAVKMLYRPTVALHAELNVNNTVVHFLIDILTPQN